MKKRCYLQTNIGRPDRSWVVPVLPWYSACVHVDHSKLAYQSNKCVRYKAYLSGRDKCTCSCSVIETRDLHTKTAIFCREKNGLFRVGCEHAMYCIITSRVYPSKEIAPPSYATVPWQLWHDRVCAQLKGWCG